MVAEINTREAGMGRKQSKHVLINVTPEQQAAVGDALDIALERGDGDSRNAILTDLLKGFCETNGVRWPDVDLQPTEGKNWKQGKGGKFVKKP